MCARPLYSFQDISSSARTDCCVALRQGFVRARGNQTITLVMFQLPVMLQSTDVCLCRTGLRNLQLEQQLSHSAEYVLRLDVQ